MDRLSVLIAVCSRHGRRHSRSGGMRSPKVVYGRVQSDAEAVKERNATEK